MIFFVAHNALIFIQSLKIILHVIEFSITKVKSIIKKVNKMKKLKSSVIGSFVVPVRQTLTLTSLKFYLRTHARTHTHTLHNTTLHYTTLHNTTLHNTTLHTHTGACLF